MTNINYEMASGLYRRNSNDRDSVVSALIIIAIGISLLFAF